MRSSMIVCGVAIGLLAVGCMTPPHEEVATTSQAIDNDPSDPPIDDDPPPPTTCKSTPGCSVTYVGGYSQSLQSQLGCTQTYYYSNGMQSGFMGGRGAYCSNTAYVRTMLHNHNIPVFDLNTYCTTCLPKQNRFFAFFGSLVTGPGCTNGCDTERWPTPP